MYLIPTWSKLLGIGIGEIDRKSRHSDVRWYGMVWYSILHTQRYEFHGSALCCYGYYDIGGQRLAWLGLAIRLLTRHMNVYL